MAEVLTGHQDYVNDDDSAGILCAGCFGRIELHEDSHAGFLAGLAAHQDAALSAAGFGPVQEARAEALAEVAEDALEGLRACCPNETLAIGFMSGYAEAARDHADSEAAP